ncbi:MAG: TRAP transporter large permease subunit, partial [Rhodovibrionaceae bacterium]
TIFALDVDPVWFGVLFSMVVGIGGITPPFGLNLFVLKAVAPPDVRLSEIYRICIPYIAIELVIVGILLLFPDLIPAFLATAS